MLRLYYVRADSAQKCVALVEIRTAQIKAAGGAYQLASKFLEASRAIGATEQGTRGLVRIFQPGSFIREIHGETIAQAGRAKNRFLLRLLRAFPQRFQRMPVKTAARQFFAVAQ